MRKRRLVLLTSIIIGATICAPSTGDAQDKFPSRSRMNAPQNLSSFGLIERSFAGKEITLDEWALYQAYCLFDGSKLPQQYRSAEPEECGTWILNDIRRRWPMLSGTTKSAMIRMGFANDGTLARPTGLDSARATVHFIVHYSVVPGDTNAISTHDGDGNGTPDYVDTVLTAVEHVWDYETSTMGYAAPPPDSGEGGDDRYDVYLVKIPYYGATFGSGKIGDNPNSPSITETNAYFTYLELRNNYIGFGLGAGDAIKVTSAHEFFHAIQSGYDNDRAAWLGEATATWIEDEVYDSINDNYGYMGSWFAHPQVPLDTNDYVIGSDTVSNHSYGSWIFFRYISEHVTGQRDVIRRTIERTAAYDNNHANHSFDEIGDALAERSTNFIRVFRNFTTANLVRTLGPYRYREGNYYPMVSRDSIRSDTTIQSALPRHSCGNFQVDAAMLPSCAQTLTVTFTPLDGVAKFGAQIVSCKDGQVSQIPFLTGITLPGDVTPDSLFITIINFDRPATTGSYRITVYALPKESKYVLTDLGPIGASGSINAVNNKGDVVGTLYSFFGGFSSYTPVKWVGGRQQYLGSDGGASDINNNDEAVGYVRIPFGNHAYYWGPSGSASIDTVTAGQSGASAINDSGYAVGTAKFPAAGGGTETNSQPFFWKNNQMTKLPLFPEPTSVGGTALDINNHNQVIGQIVVSDTAFPFSAKTHAALWGGAGSAPQDLGVDFIPQRFNDAGFYVGNASFNVGFDGTTTSASHPVLGSGGGYSDLGTPDQLAGIGIALGVNNMGDVVGWTVTGAGWHAFLYSAGLMSDLNALLGFGTCWTLQTASAISDSGHIAGAGRPAADPGRLHGFLLTPSAPTGVLSARQLPSRFDLYQNYPNPFNPATTIRYELPKFSHVSLKLFNVLGQQVAVLANSHEAPGVHSVKFNGGGLPSGVYFYRLHAGDFVSTKKLVLMK